MQTALAALPREWRRALTLRHVEERSDAEIAKTLRKPEAEIKRTLEWASQFLRQRLVESGCALKGNERADTAGREHHG